MRAVDALSPETLKHDTVSSLVRHLEETLPVGEEVTIGQFLAILGVYGFVFLLLILALLNVAIFIELTLNFKP